MANQSNRPADTAFKQQRLKSWQPLLTPKNVIPIFFVIGVVFLPIGIALYVYSESVKEIIIDYTKCKNGGVPNSQNLPIEGWSYGTNENNENVCTLKFQILEDIKKPVFMYYRLTNFYQNHRNYFKSYNPKQYKAKTLAEVISGDNVDKACDPFNKSGSKFYYPCGLVANSFFSDEIIGDKIQNVNGGNYLFPENGISWSSDRDKYSNLQVNQEVVNTLIPPPAWKKFPQYRDGKYTVENFPRLADMERFQVWMRVAGLPNFRKLYGQNKDNDLPKGNYTIQIVDRFDVESFGGTKSIIISNVSAFGGKNPFLGIGYMVVGALSLLLGLIFLVKNMVKPRKLGDTSYLSYKTQ